MKTITLALALLGMTGFAAAQKPPSYKEARALYDQLGKPVAASGVWWKKPLPERQQALRDADALAKRADALFGSTTSRFASCRSAVLAMRTFIGDLNDLALVVEGRNEIKHAVALFSPSFNAVDFGEKKAACYEEVESLDAPAAK
ncbi:hypothetical protein J2W28_002077 [Variovorax boronicumulans]|uniref:hypothetical protein n=1 Tax=Variovorax boronicumulans TaxID=436515 RepID=UPI002782C104|nr:hypothetical protein [Variovorax boronicumulans]MDP9990907.1 hypothetical protein [Variovorax boronicumulans]MDQ0002935.1 hypothetical protein [Variovorax boronicumulans]